MRFWNRNKEFIPSKAYYSFTNTQMPSNCAITNAKNKIENKAVLYQGDEVIKEAGN